MQDSSGVHLQASGDGELRDACADRAEEFHRRFAAVFELGARDGDECGDRQGHLHERVREWCA